MSGEGAAEQNSAAQALLGRPIWREGVLPQPPQGTPPQTCPSCGESAGDDGAIFDEPVCLNGRCLRGSRLPQPFSGEGHRLDE